MGKIKAAIIDIDNTIISSSYIFKMLADKSKTEQFKYFYAHVQECPPIEWLIDIVKAATKGLKIVFLTGRGAECKEATIEHLYKLGFDSFELCMRPQDDYRPDEEVKKEWLDELVKTHDFKFAIDDREANCKLYTETFNIPSLVVYYPLEERY